MPIDINWLRVDRGGDPEKIKESQRRRYKSVELVDEIISLDNDWRKLTGLIDNLKKEKNSIQKLVAQKKKAKEECDEQVAQIKSLGEEVEKQEAAQEALQKSITKKLNTIGNIVDPTVPVSNNEDNNGIVSVWGSCRDPKGLLNHHDLLWRIGGYEPERGVGVAGHRAYFLKDVGVLLNQAFINYGITFLRARKYNVLQPPYFMKADVMAGVAQLEEFDEALYKVTGDGEEDKYLIATSEQPICGYHKGEWLTEKDLPIRYSGVSTCFRKEAGAHGKDTWGIFRVHQFEKIEQFMIVEGDLETSQKAQEEMLKCAEEFYQSLGFPYQVINIVSGALNNAAIRKYDLECWFPGYNAYRELVSCSNCTDYQSRSMEIRCGAKKLGDSEKKYVHMLNATLCATGRAICCLLENYQESDGVRIPEVLVPFMGGLTFLPFVRDARNAPANPSASLKSAPPTATVTESKTEVKQQPPKKQVPETKPIEKPQATAQPSNISPEEAALNAAITAKGDEVRDAKAKKADKAVIQALVAELLALKNKLAELNPSAAPAPAPADKKDKKATPPTEQKPKEQKTKDQKPAAHSKAPVNETTESKPVATKPHASTSIWENGQINLDALEAKLKIFSYVSGYAPSAEDNRVFTAVQGTNFANYKQIVRWHRLVSATSTIERETWI